MNKCNPTSKSILYAAIAAGSIAFAIASSGKALADVHPSSWDDVASTPGVIYVPVKWVNAEDEMDRIKSRKAVKNAIEEMNNNPNCINYIEENANQMASVR